MKVEMVIEGTAPRENNFYWDFTMNYGKQGTKLNPVYAVQIADLGSTYAAFINNKAGGAASGDPTYSAKFKITGADVPETFAAGGKGIAGEANDLLYSDAVAIQNDGIKLLAQLNVFAEYEIKAGKRK